MEYPRKKVVIFSAFYEPFMSGAEQMVKQIAEHVGPRFDLAVITGKYEKELPETEQRPDFRLIRVGIGHKKIDKLLYPFYAAIAAKRCEAEIVHAVMESYAGAALLVTKYLYPRAKRILTLQSGNLDLKMAKANFALKYLWRQIHLSADRLTAISSFLAARAKRLGVPAEKISITPNGVDFHEIPKTEQKIAKRVICVARLSWEKGLDHLVKAWPRVLAAEPEAKLVLVGEGDKRSEIEALVKELDIAASVELKGNLPHPQVLHEIKKSELFICPSLAEGLGIVFIEAQACGVPVIGTRVGGIPDVIQDGVNGLLIEPKNQKEIGIAVIGLLRDPELRQSFAAAAAVSVKRYEWNNVLLKFIDLYDHL